MESGFNSQSPQFFDNLQNYTTVIMKKWLTIWLTWLSGSGKSTLSKKLYKHLCSQKINTELLDWDNIRKWLTKDLGFSKEDRHKNLERGTFLSKLLSRNGVAVICAFISPFKEDREFVRKHTTNFVQIYVNAPLEVCEKRDIKWLYKKARKWEISNFTWISQTYEEPSNPEIQVFTDKESIEESSKKIIKYLEEKKFI